MCFILKDNTKPQIATEDIVAYKFARRLSDGRLFGVYCKNYKYAPINERHPEIVLEVIRDRSLEKIEEGYHLFKGIYDVRSARMTKFSLQDEGQYGYSIICYKCIIPKGTRFYQEIQRYSNLAEIVAETFILIEEIAI